MPVRTAHGPKTTGKTAKAAERGVLGGNEASREAEASGRQRRAKGEPAERQGGREAEARRERDETCPCALHTAPNNGDRKSDRERPAERQGGREAEPAERQGGQQRRQSLLRGRGRQKARPAERQGGREESPLFVAQGQCPQCHAVSAVLCSVRCAVLSPQCCAGLCSVRSAVLGRSAVQGLHAGLCPSAGSPFARRLAARRSMLILECQGSKKEIFCTFLGKICKRNGTEILNLCKSRHKKTHTQALPGDSSTPSL